MNKKIFFMYSFFIFVTILVFVISNLNNKSDIEVKKEIKSIKKTMNKDSIEDEAFIKEDEKKIDKTNSSKLSKKKEINKDNIINTENIKEENNNVILTSFNIDKGRYSVKVISDKEITSNKDLIKYIAFRGEFINTENIISKFNFSIDSKYTEYSDNIKLLIDDVTTKKKTDYECDGYFLSGLSFENIYKLNMDISTQNANCYISDTFKLPERTKNLLKNMENITLDKNGKIKL